MDVKLKPDTSREGIDLAGDNATPIGKFYGGRTDYDTKPKSRTIQPFENEDRNLAKKDKIPQQGA
jgi:hypothetical protein